MPASRPKAVRLLDVARAAGVSRVAAAHVLNGAGSASVRVGETTRRRIQSIARKLNYRPNRAAQQLRGVPSGLIGVIFDSQWPTNLSRLSHLEQAGNARGLRFMVGQVHGDPRLAARYLDDFADRGVQGILCIVDLKACFLSELEPLFQGRPNVIFHGRPLDPHGLCIRVDTEDGIRQCVAHLLQRGRRRIGLLLSQSNDEFMVLRRRGYLAEFAARGVNVDENNVDESLVWCAEVPSGLPDPESLDAAIDRLVVQQRADAIIAADDVWAVRLIQRLKSRGYRVPEDVAIVGYDNLDLATVIEPSLTTIDQQHGEYARAVVKMLEQLAEPGTIEPAERMAVIKPRLVVRASTASPAR